MRRLAGGACAGCAARRCSICQGRRQASTRIRWMRAIWWRGCGRWIACPQWSSTLWPILMKRPWIGLLVAFVGARGERRWSWSPTRSDIGGSSRRLSRMTATACSHEMLGGQLNGLQRWSKRIRTNTNGTMRLRI
ncbi:unnamed protein product [Chondrus crispus]|uniref:Uncharacterized protein n=1 Tax=Chondrus crispus TaxID=2769 RepID=R7QE97_CHOCR|nr:unnamed protein product [Chondrus crispus]CDF35781.1 unnamed protein product [Chondrus crispus]|eukprot:XP_005715600.1 unnamed protein product [Chondrus crispus]